MTKLADADLRGSTVGAPAWPSPDCGAPHTELPPPPAPAAPTAVEMPGPLIHEPTAHRDAPSSTTTELPTPSATPASTFLDDRPPAPFTASEASSIPVSAPVPEPAPTAEPAPAAELAPSPAMQTGPAAILAPDAAVAPIDNAAITLPAVVAAPPSTKPMASIESFLTPETHDASARKTKQAGGGRLGRFVLAALVVGGLGYAGTTYGPGLYDEYIADEEPAEPAAPLAFPRARTTTPEVRTATFVLEGLATGSEASYTVTVDFETHVSRVVIDRTDAPDLEVLTFSDDALVRRLDSSSWFQIERGDFPLDDQLQRTDWVRMIDELVPPERRAGVVIDESTIATVAGIETRHLVLTLDPALLELVDETGASLDPIQDIADAAASADAAAADDAVAASVGADVAAPVADPQAVTEPGVTRAGEEPLAVETVPVAGEPVGPNAIQVELWIDRQGVVRRSVGADVLGANSITILDTATDAWVPDYPDAALVQPMTAAALIELGF